jgi:hypothetical protein
LSNTQTLSPPTLSCGLIEAALTLSSQARSLFASEAESKPAATAMIVIRDFDRSRVLQHERPGRESTATAITR